MQMPSSTASSVTSASAAPAPAASVTWMRTGSVSQGRQAAAGGTTETVSFRSGGWTRSGARPVARWALQTVSAVAGRITLTATSALGASAAVTGQVTSAVFSLSVMTRLSMIRSRCRVIQASPAKGARICTRARSPGW